MNHPAKAQMARRRRALFTVGALLAACALALPQFGAADAATPGANYNTSTACEGKYADKATKLVAFKSFKFYVNGVQKSTEYREVSKMLIPGAQVKVVFELKPECDNTYVAIDTYALPSNGFKPSEASQQRLIKRVGGAFPAGKVHTLTTTLPTCWFQMDVNTGWEYKPGDYTLDKRGRLLLAGTGGEGKCESTTTTTAKPTTTSTVPTTTTTTTSTTVPTTTTTSTTTTTTTTVPTTTTTTTTTVPPTTTTSTTVQPAESNPSATFRQICAVDGSGWTVTYRNDGDARETFVLQSGSEIIDTVGVDGNRSVTRTYSFEEHGVEADESIELEVLVDGDVIADTSITNDCFDVTATVACDTENGTGAVFTFRNSGKVEEIFTVTADGTEVEGSPVRVAAGTTSRYRLPAEGDGDTARIVIEGERSGFTFDDDVTIRCVEVLGSVVEQTTTTTAPAEVLGETVTRPQLAETGFDPTVFSAIGVFLLGIGAVLMRAARRMRFAD